MDHNRAVELQAVDRYLLGELAPEERESFEEHYFSCEECAAEVRLAARFRANAREVLLELQHPRAEAPAKPWLSWTSLAPMAATAALLGVVIYQNAVVFPGLRAPQMLSDPLILDGTTRGSLPLLQEGRPVEITMSIPAAGQAPVRTELVTEAGKTLARGTTERPGPDQPYRVYFPGRFGRGQYRVIVRDAATGQELVQNAFEIAAKEANPK